MNKLLTFSAIILLALSCNPAENLSNNSEKLSNNPIGVFDSGTGGLTVLEVLLSVDQVNNNTGSAGADGISDLNSEHFSYLGDMANMPYGLYDSKGKADYLRELIIKDAEFLLGDSYYETNIDTVATGSKLPSKILVIACNTATAYGLKDVEEFLKADGRGIQVVGVINAGVDALFEMMEGGDEVGAAGDSVAVGVLATMGTISSGAYERTIREYISESGYSGFVKVINQPGVGFAEAVDQEPLFVNSSLNEVRNEYQGPSLGNGPYDLDVDLLPVYNFDDAEGYLLTNEAFDRDPRSAGAIIQLNSATNYARYNLVSLFEQHRTSRVQVPLKHVILGCTHYPFLLETLYQVVDELRAYSCDGVYPYRDIIHEDFSFVDPAYFTAIECYDILRTNKMLTSRKESGKLDIYLSVPAPWLPEECLDSNNMLNFDFKYGREVGTGEVHTIQVPFSEANLSNELLQRLEIQVPYTWEKLN